MKYILSAMAFVTFCAGAASAFAASGRAGGRFALTRNAAITQAAGNYNTVLMMSASPMDFVKSEIASNNVMVFSKSYCPFCKSTKSILSDLNADAKVIELDEIENGDEIQDALLELSGQRTVPNVFVGGEHVGGNDDTMKAAKSGKLQEMIGK